MKKWLVLMLLVTLFTLIIFSCNSQLDYDNNTISITSSVTSTQNLFWLENQGHFYTQDIDKAQKNIPFPILLPDYFPGGGQSLPVPLIDGPLGKSKDDSEIVKINIKYAINIRDDLSALIIIIERNAPYTLGEPDVNPQLERIEIQGLTVVKTKDEWSPDRDTYYGFNSKGIYYVIEMHNITDEECFKVVESMILQLV